ALNERVPPASGNSAARIEFSSLNERLAVYVPLFAPAPNAPYVVPLSSTSVPPAIESSPAVSVPMATNSTVSDAEGTGGRVIAPTVVDSCTTETAPSSLVLEAVAPPSGSVPTEALAPTPASGPGSFALVAPVGVLEDEHAPELARSPDNTPTTTSFMPLGPW